MDRERAASAADGAQGAIKAIGEQLPAPPIVAPPEHRGAGGQTLQEGTQTAALPPEQSFGGCGHQDKRQRHAQDGKKKGDVHKGERLPSVKFP